MRMSRVSVGLLLAVSLIASACGDSRGVGGDSGSLPGVDGGSNAGLTAAQFCDAFTRINCEANQRCCTDPARMPASIEACMAVALPRCSMLVEGDGFRTGHVRLDAAAAAALLDTLEADAAACVGTSLYRINITEGTVGAGGDCSVTADDFSNAASCADGLGCALDYTTYAGTCQPLAVHRAPCGSGIAPCGEGLHCASGSATCEILRDDGEPCNADTECWSYYCSGVCGPRPGHPHYCL